MPITPHRKLTINTLAAWRRARPLVATTAAMLLALSATAWAAPANVAIIADRDLGDAMAAAAGVPAGGAGTACLPQPAALPRIALLAYQPRQAEVDACERQAGGKAIILDIGYQAAALVAPANAPIFAVSSADLFRAIARHAGGQRAPASWRDVDATLPTLQVGFFAPPAGSTANRLLNTTVMEPACSKGTHADLPFDSARRAEFCGALRVDPSIVERKGDIKEVADWAASAPAGQIAVVTMAELRQLGQAVVVVPLDGMLPTAGNVASGQYPVAEKVTMLIVVPASVPPTGMESARRAAFELLSEAGVGPDGALTQAGLVPRPPGERIAARTQAMTFLQSR